MRGKAVWRGIDGLVDAVCIVACAILVVVSFAGVIFRYVLNDSLVWSEELARYLFIWIIFLGAAIGVRQGAHIALDIFVAGLPARIERGLLWIERVAIFVFALMILVPGRRLVEIGMSNLSPALEIPMGLVYAAPVVSALLMISYLFRPQPERPAPDPI
jgi:TRAP-type C4-dicarboxylate transport system permease small subunit